MMASSQRSQPHHSRLPFDIRDHIDALLDTACYPEHPANVTLAETHISCVFLAGNHVYKLKKPVDFGFVDYSTRARRRRFCELEVTLNRRLANDIYLGVVPLVRTREGFRFEAKGVVLDWAVKMRRVPDPAFWSERLRNGSLALPEMDRLARFIAAFHERARRVRSPAVLAQRSRAWDETVADLERFAGRLFPQALIAEIRTAGQHYRAWLEPLLQQRLRAGRFVDGHGDLRLEHICEIDGQLQALDCIEFNTAFRHIDVGSDLAFLLMDLDRNDRRDLAGLLAAIYLRLSGDATLPLCDRYYRAERALVRAKVDALAWASSTSPEEHQRRGERAERWAQLGATYLSSSTRPAVLIVRGISGSGKTTLATRLAIELGWAWLASDYIRKGVQRGVQDRHKVEISYTPTARHGVYQRMHRIANSLLVAGYPVILDATYLDRDAQAEVAALIRRRATPAFALTLQARPETLHARLEQRTETLSDADWSVAATQLASPTTPFSAHGIEERSIETEGPIDDTVRRALAHISSWLHSAGISAS